MKRKIMKFGAPCKALSPYNYFYREKVALYKKVDSKTFFNFMKEISFQYNNLSVPDKQKYIEMAQNDKLRYDEDMKEFKKTSNYKQYMKSLASKSKPISNHTKKDDIKKTENKKKTEVNKPVEVNKQINNGSEIPIFTKEFLEHNQHREEHLRNIKKQANQLEEQTALLSKHLENLNNAIEQSNKSIHQFQEDTNILGNINSIIDHGLLSCISKLKQPMNLKQLNMQINKSNIPLYISALKEILQYNSDVDFIVKLKDKMKNFPLSVLPDLKKL